MLVLTGLTKDFGGFRAVDHCSFSMAEGSITRLIGPNCVGKTSLFNLVTGTLWPADGRVEFLGDDISLLALHNRFARGLFHTFMLPHTIHCLTVFVTPPVAPHGTE